MIKQIEFNGINVPIAVTYKHLLKLQMKHGSITKGVQEGIDNAETIEMLCLLAIEQGAKIDKTEVKVDIEEFLCYKFEEVASYVIGQIVKMTEGMFPKELIEKGKQHLAK